MATGYVDPNVDGSVNWNLFSGSSHYAAVNSGTRQPTAGDTGNYVYVSHGEPPAYTEEFGFTTLDVSEVTEITLWVYGGSNNGYNSLYAEIYINGAWQSSKQVGAASTGWMSATWTGTWTTLDDLKAKFSNSYAGPPGQFVSYNIYDTYAVATYTAAGPTYEQLSAGLVASAHASGTTMGRHRRVMPSGTIASQLDTDVTATHYESLNLSAISEMATTIVARRSRRTTANGAIEGDIATAVIATPEYMSIPMVGAVSAVVAGSRTRRMTGITGGIESALAASIRTPNISTIDPTGGGDFLTLQAWINWAKVQANTNQWAKVQGAGNIGPGDFSGWSSMPTYNANVRVYTAPEWRHNGSYDASKPRIDISGDQYQRAVLITVPYVTIEGLQIRATSGSPTGVRVQSAVGATIDSNLMTCVGSTHWTNAVLVRDSGSTAFLVQNNIVQCGTDSGALISTYSNTGDTLSGQILNNTIVKGYRGVTINSY